jgi:glycosyltransferase involved in cell wall biosynthesis
MASGVPVVATDVADNARIVPEGRVGHTVGLNDVTAMTERVVALLADPACLRAMGASARRHAEAEFSLARLARDTEAVYVDALRRYGGRRGRMLAGGVTG